MELVCVMGDSLSLSCLGHTWLIDLDGTIVKHNGYKIDGVDSLLDGAKVFLDSIPQGDMIVFLTSREVSFRCQTEEFLKDNQIRFDLVIYGLPYGERILLNDKKESGLKTAIAVNKDRNSDNYPVIAVDCNL